MPLPYHAAPGWWSAWLAREHLRFPHAGRLHRIWVQPAAAPEDYRFENLAWRVRANMGIQVRNALNAGSGVQYVAWTFPPGHDPHIPRWGMRTAH